MYPKNEICYYHLAAMIMINTIPSMASPVYWYDQKKVTYLPMLDGDKQTEVVIVGGGMAGLSAAQRLIKDGRSVMLVEKDFCGSGASGKSSGFITPDSEIELSALLTSYGPEKAREIWEFVLSGVEIVRRNILEHAIPCDYQTQDSLFIANNQAGFAYIRNEHETRQLLGYKSTLHDGASVKSIMGSLEYTGGVQYPDTFGINSFLYCQALKDIIISQGAIIYEQTPVTDIQEGMVVTKSGSIRARHIIVCADRFIPDFGRMEKEIYHVQTFLGMSRPLGNAEIAKMFPENKLMVWDTDLVYNYFRAAGGNRLLIGGGDLLYTYARSVSQNTERFKKRLTRYIQKKFPFLPIELEYIWPGMLGVSKDLLPVMGFDPDSKHIWLVGAATGLPWAAALGYYAAEKYLSGRNEFDDIFSWKRKFVIGRRMQAILTTPPTYALSHGIAEYF